MEMIKKVRALGLMSSTSLDGVDAAVISTDGVDVYEHGPNISAPYDDELREHIRGVQGLVPQNEEDQCRLAEIEAELTRFHADVVEDFLTSTDEKIDLIGFHGHTIKHDAPNHYTLQLGNGRLLADLTGVRVVNHFAASDIRSGGQGAPLTAVYYQALCHDEAKPAAMLHIGGCTDITWIGSNGELLAFDIGPGNAPINDWVLKHGGQHMDYNGKLAVLGTVNEKIVNAMMRHKYFAKYPPKSCDRNLFNDKLEHLEALSLEDGAATVTAFIAEAIVYSLAMYVPEMPKKVIVCGGGAKNPTLLRFLRQRLEKTELQIIGEMGLIPTAVEAEAFAYLAVRSIHGLPLSYPSTTGAPEPVGGGRLFEPHQA